VDYVSNALLTFILSLQITIIIYMIKQEKRLTKIEVDLYRDPKNPSKRSITEQILELKEKLESLEEKITKIYDIINKLT